MDCDLDLMSDQWLMDGLVARTTPDAATPQKSSGATVRRGRLVGRNGPFGTSPQPTSDGELPVSGVRPSVLIQPQIRRNMKAVGNLAFRSILGRPISRKQLSTDRHTVSPPHACIDYM